MSEAFLGEVRAYGFNFAPRNFAVAQGATMSIAQNSALFSLLGTTYGGNGQTTFQLPNLGGRYPMGQGQSPGTSQYVMGELAGSENITLTQLQMPMHIHLATTQVTTDSSALAATSNVNVFTGVPPASRLGTPVGNNFTIPVTSGNPVNGFAAPGSGTAAQMASGAVTTTISGTVAAGATTTVQTAGGSQPFNIQSPYLVINYCICTSGIFPSRN